MPFEKFANVETINTEPRKAIPAKIGADLVDLIEHLERRITKYMVFIGRRNTKCESRFAKITR